MRRAGRRRHVAATALGLLAAVSLSGATAATANAPKKKPPKPIIVTVGDFYYGPNAVKVKKGGSIKWVWSAANSEPHDVHLKTAPKGLKKKGTYSTKTTAVTNARFQKTFDTPGSYKYICTIHPTEMTMTVTVKK